MKKMAYILIGFMLVLIGGIGLFLSQIHEESGDEKETEPLSVYEVDLISIKGTSYLPLPELVEKAGGAYKYDPIDKQAVIEWFGDRFHMTKGEAVVLVNGYYKPLSYKMDAGKLLVEYESFKKVFPFYETGSEGQTISLEKRTLPTVVCRPGDAELNEERMRSMRVPLPNVNFPTLPGQLAGGERAYRNGIHQGIDWYYDGDNQMVTFDTAVFSMTEGVVVRADHQYNEMEEEDRNQFLEIAQEFSTTPAYILDKMRGRQVWIQSETGVAVRYAHLYQVDPMMEVGVRVEKGQRVGSTGNSGTSDGVTYSDEGIHLHSDILLCGQHFWEYYPRFDEANSRLRSMFEVD
ncbi:peptidoglycan DD-metalloendopeptidase family protein (plasmid) [Pontibacillus sp. ALD_SL1]|uniref:M23 family metallopeptidase n=1 Tax=Pontibacillus sp. ALD_SL1 TaxID=2777185 RepID=UPI001A97BF62|nr:M23 family metallopeptidase [Pontibacillus sp. ALD_SL1]QST02360.1 peptidoglycan DD-metalloendopeptidase family protein [Pontibacillus sp. ALD_SL1]